MTNSRCNLLTEPLFKSVDILNVEDILHLQLLKFYHRYYNKNIPEIFLNLGLKENAEGHARLTRNRCYINVERAQFLNAVVITHIDLYVFMYTYVLLLLTRI